MSPGHCGRVLVFCLELREQNALLSVGKIPSAAILDAINSLRLSQCCCM